MSMEALAVAAVLAAVCAAVPSSGGAQGRDVRPLEATNDFGFRLYTALAGSNAEPNLIVSPVSVQLALAMVWNGAAGEARDAMGRVLGYGALRSDDVNTANARTQAMLQDAAAGVRTDIANGLWGRAGVEFDPGFLAQMRDAYAAMIDALDFGAPESAEVINGWVGRKTQGKIRELVDAPSIRDAMMVLVNALYFHGRWTEPFPKAATRSRPFALLGGGRRDVAMMEARRTFRYLRNDMLQAVRLPFGPREQAALYVLLPHPGRFEELAR
ncbi:MAG TPA: serpin family protein, partial [Chthonomonadales bacterium]|nr:serpin family protein [Chthonomonadales bacterium]